MSDEGHYQLAYNTRMDSAVCAHYYEQYLHSRLVAKRWASWTASVLSAGSVAAIASTGPKCLSMAIAVLATLVTTWLGISGKDQDLIDLTKISGDWHVIARKWELMFTGFFDRTATISDVRDLVGQMADLESRSSRFPIPEREKAKIEEMVKKALARNDTLVQYVQEETLSHGKEKITP